MCAHVSVCPHGLMCVCVCVSGLAPLRLSLAVHRGDPRRLHGRLQDLVPQPMPVRSCLSPPLAQGAHTAEGSVDPPASDQASRLACPPLGHGGGVVAAGSEDTGGTEGEADRFPAAAGAG